MKEKKYTIIDENNLRSCVTVEAANEASALKKYRKGLMSSGFYEIITEKDGRPRLVSSFGSCFRADKKAEFIDGDLVKDKKINIFVHQTNCFGVMGAGIAAQIAKTYPNVAETDRKYCRKKKAYGTILCIPTEDGRICVNMYSQYAYGRGKQTNNDKFQLCLYQLMGYLKTQNSDVIVGFPDHIGCGLAGGDWNEILPMLEDFAARVSQPVVIVRYAPEKEA